MNNIIYQNEQEFKEKLAKIKSQGLNSLHIVADFDLTLTNTNSVPTWEVCPLGNEYVIERDRQKAIYLPIEYDPNLSLEVKNEKMDEWWKLHLSALIKYGLTKEIIDKGILHTKITPRERLSELCSFTNEKKIPFLILSAGLGDVIQEFFKLKNMLYSNMHIVSNFFIFNADGKPTGFQDDVVHSCNKSEVHLRGGVYMKEIENRKNVILLGDSPGDVDMVKGVDYDTVIKIGFLNGKTDKLEFYKKLYDVIITREEGLGFVVGLLNDFK